MDASKEKLVSENSPSSYVSIPLRLGVDNSIRVDQIALMWCPVSQAFILKLNESRLETLMFGLTKLAATPGTMYLWSPTGATVVIG